MKPMPEKDRNCGNCAHQATMVCVTTCEANGPEDLGSKWEESKASLEHRADTRIEELESGIKKYLDIGMCKHPVCENTDDDVEIISCTERGLCETLYGKKD